MFCLANRFGDVVFTSLQGETDYSHLPTTPTHMGRKGVCMSTSTTTMPQKPFFSNVEKGEKLAPRQAVPVTGSLQTPLYNEWPRQRVPRNITNFDFDHRASFHGRG